MRIENRVKVLFNFSHYGKYFTNNYENEVGGISEWLLGPFVLLHNLLFLFGGEVVLDVEELSDLLHALAFDEWGDLGAREFE